MARKKLYSLTPEHRAQLEPWARKWIANAMSTKPMDDEGRAICRDAVRRLYEAAGLRPPPRIVFVPSPFVLRFAGGYAAAYWHRRAATSAVTRAATDAATRAATLDATDAATLAATLVATRAATSDATYAATRAATLDATSDATYAATRAATRAATLDATSDATYAATRAATLAATLAATRDATRAATRGDSNEWWFSPDVIGCVRANGMGDFGISCAQSAWNMWQGGNQWSAWDSYITFFRHVAKLPIDYSKYDAWEQLSLHSGPRIVHPEFCMISDRPEILTVDESNRPHGENGPFCRWRDGTGLYAWHGVRVPWHWIERKDELTPQTALTWKNIEQRRAACEIIGWSRILRELDAKVIDRDPDPEIGELIEVALPDIGKERFLRVRCGTGREFALPVPPNTKTALSGNAWTYDIPENLLQQKEIRT